MSNDLYNMLRNPRMREFHNAVDALRGIPNDQAIHMLDELCNDENAEFRCRGLDGLVKISPDRAESMGLHMLVDADPAVRWWAVYWLCILGARTGSRTAVPAIARLLQTDPDELVRSVAASALGDIGDTSVLPALQVAVATDRGTDHEGRRISGTAQVAIQKILQRSGPPAA